MTEKIKIEYTTKKISEKHNDSFWYDGLIATLTYKDRIVKIYAVGEIRIQRGHSGKWKDTERAGELVHDGWKSRNSGIELENDDDLKKVGSNYDDEFYWENNNWFDFCYSKKGWDSQEDILGEVAYDYDEAIDMAKEWLKDEDWWKEIGTE